MSQQVSPLRQRMIDDMTIRNMSPLTQKSYILDAHRALNDREPESGMRVLSLGRSLQQLSPGAWSIESRPPRAVRRLRPQGAARVAWVQIGLSSKSSSSRSSCASRSSSWNPFDGWMFYLKSR
jgi:hypothetical protein